MKRYFKKLSALIIVFFFLWGCASTELKTVWMDDTYKGGPLKKVFVMGVSHKPTIKRLFEDEFVRELKAHGTDAIASYTVIPDEKMHDKDYITSAISKLGIDSVLVTVLVDKQTLNVYYPLPMRYSDPYYRGGWQGHYAQGLGYYATPGYVVRDEVVVLETSVYDLNSDKPVFSALSETYLEDSPDVLIRSFVQLMVQELARKNLLLKP